MRYPRLLFSLLCVVLCARLAFAQDASRPATQSATLLARHAVIISIDGCRPDVLLRADTPTIHHMITQGSFTFYAETTDVAITLPSHASMITGVKPEQHGINFNSDPPDDQIVYPSVPTIFELAKKQGLSTALVSTKSKFRIFARPGSVDYLVTSAEKSSPDDLGFAKKAAEIIRSHQPGAMLVHFGNNDKVGHAMGWGSPEQLKALEETDNAVKTVLQALQDAHIDQQTLVILTSDHGGSGKQHGAGDPRSRYIPWIVTGPHVRHGYDLTLNRPLTVHTEDTFATACYFLGVPLPDHIYGKPITQLLQP